MNNKISIFLTFFFLSNLVYSIDISFEKCILTEMNLSSKSSWRIPSLGLLLNTTPNITIQERDTPSGKHKRFLYRGSKNWIELKYVNTANYSSVNFNPMSMEETGFGRSLRAHHSIVRFYEEGVENKRQWIRVYIETPNGKVVLFQNNAITDSNETTEIMGEQLAELLNYMEIFSPDEPSSKEGVGLVKLQQVPLQGQMLFASDTASLVVAYRSAINAHWLEVFDKASQTGSMQKELKNIAKIIAIDAHEGHFVALVEMPLPSHMTNVRSHCPEIRLHRYRMDGTLLMDIQVMASIDVNKTSDKGYRAYAQPSVALTHNRIAVAMGTAGLFSDGLIHVGEGNFIFNIEGKDVLRNEWTVSHSFQQFVAKGYERLSFISVGDGLPYRAINGFSVNHDTEQSSVESNASSSPPLVRDLSNLFSRKNREDSEKSSQKSRESSRSYRYHFFPFPGKTGDNYVYDTHIAAAFHNHGNTIIVFESELYEGFQKNPFHIQTGALSNGSNQLFLNLRNCQNDNIIQLTRDHSLDHHVTAALKYPDGKVLLSILTFKAVDGVEFNSLKYWNLNSLEHNLAKHVIFDEYLMLLDTDGKVLQSRIEHSSVSDRYQVCSLNGTVYNHKGHLFLSNNTPVLFRNVTNSALMEFISIAL